jgi:hypothetical protein
VTSEDREPAVGISATLKVETFDANVNGAGAWGRARGLRRSKSSFRGNLLWAGALQDPSR